MNWSVCSFWMPQVADVLQFSVETGGFLPNCISTLQESLIRHLKIAPKHLSFLEVFSPGESQGVLRAGFFWRLWENNLFPCLFSFRLYFGLWLLPSSKYITQISSFVITSPSPLPVIKSPSVSSYKKNICDYV